jgi:hypothetical protein
VELAHVPGEGAVRPDGRSVAQRRADPSVGVAGEKRELPVDRPAAEEPVRDSRLIEPLVDLRERGEL